REARRAARRGDLRRRLAAARVVAVADKHAAALACEEQRRLPTDSRRRAGDERGLALDESRVRHGGRLLGARRKYTRRGGRGITAGEDLLLASKPEVPPALFAAEDPYPEWAEARR